MTDNITMKAIIASINIGPNRSRIQVVIDDDFNALVASMRDDGLLEPIVIDEANNLLAGHRRLTAAKLLGWTTIAATVKKVSEDDTERDITSLIENLIRSNPTPADYAESFFNARNNLVERKGMRPRMAEVYIASRTGQSPQKVHNLIRIKERLSPALFRAFRGVGGVALTVAEAMSYSRLSATEQAEVWAAWRAVGGRKTSAGDEDDAPMRPPQPHQPIENVRRLLRLVESDDRLLWTDNSELVLQSHKAVIAIVLQWFLSTRSECVIKKAEGNDE